MHVQLLNVNDERCHFRSLSLSMHLRCSDLGQSLKKDTPNRNSPPLWLCVDALVRHLCDLCNRKMFPRADDSNLCLLQGSFAWLLLHFALCGVYICEHLRGIFEDLLLCCVL